MSVMHQTRNPRVVWHAEPGLMYWLLLAFMSIQSIWSSCHASRGCTTGISHSAGYPTLPYSAGQTPPGHHRKGAFVDGNAEMGTHLEVVNSDVGMVQLHNVYIYISIHTYDII